MNPLVIVGIVVAVIVAIVVGCQIFGVDLFATLSGESATIPTEFNDVNDLSSGKAYVWHLEGGNHEDELSTAVDKNVFFTCIIPHTDIITIVDQCLVHWAMVFYCLKWDTEGIFDAFLTSTARTHIDLDI